MNLKRTSAITILIDEKISQIIMMLWVLSCLIAISYLSEYNDRYTFYKELKLSQEKEQWKNLLNQLPLGIVVSKNGNIDFFNKECLQIFNKKNSETVLTPESFSVIKEKDSENSIKDLINNTALLPSTIKKQYLYENELAQTQYFCVRYSTITFCREESTAIILQDQTSFQELKKLDEKYQRLYMSSVVHDIRTPLNGILGMLEVIEQSEPNDDIKKYLSVARSSAKMLLFLTYDLTDYSQIEAGVLTISKDSFSPINTVNDCTQLLEYNFKSKGIALSTSYSLQVPQSIFSDKNRFIQIIMNLLGNALKFTFSGGVKVMLDYDNSEDILTTSVEDSGIGIKEEDMPKLFTLFGKVKESNSHNPTGVGLGLTICKKLAICLGGDISAKSAYGKGSIFTFRIKCSLPIHHRKDSIDSMCIDENIDLTMARMHNFSESIHPSPMSPNIVLLCFRYIGEE